ncbi:MAG TPA: alkaline phosphatase family protein, partial [Solirubrobacteraceae bacterium]|nr:alkaline phosphatase family protein [Solirubrobacteraceae bacterium]
AMDSWVSVHVDPNVNGTRDGVNTMGYYLRADLPFYHALADNFTICDGYFCSVLGPTDPNRLYSMTATLDPDGKHGGPSLQTLVSNRTQTFGKYNWPTYPEQLQAKGISWKIYGTPDGNFGDNVLAYFAAYQQNPQLAANAFAPTFPANFQADCAAGTLPQVSWVLASLVQSEHPPAAVTQGEVAASQILNALTSNPAVWAKTALFITYDENGGFFDHVPPPTAPPGTAGEYLTVNPVPSIAKDRQGNPVLGPIGLGIRVPMLVVSPFSRGGLVCSDTFDHTSLLRFLETRFGPEVPNLTPWRRSVTGDMTSAFNFVAAPDAAVPKLPTPSPTDPRTTNSDCQGNGPDVGNPNFPTVKGYTLPPPPLTLPAQEPGTARRPSGLCAAQNPPASPTTPDNPLGLPPTTGCVDTRQFTFRIHRPHGRRVVRLDVSVNGRHVRTVRAPRNRSITRLTLMRLPVGNFSLKIVAHTRHGNPVITVREYHGCTKGPPHHLHRHKRGRRTG